MPGRCMFLPCYTPDTSPEPEGPVRKEAWKVYSTWYDLRTTFLSRYIVEGKNKPTNQEVKATDSYDFASNNEVHGKHVKWMLFVSNTTMLQLATGVNKTSHKHPEDLYDSTLDVYDLSCSLP